MVYTVRTMARTMVRLFLVQGSALGSTTMLGGLFSFVFFLCLRFGAVARPTKPHYAYFPYSLTATDEELTSSNQSCHAAAHERESRQRPGGS